VDLIDAAELGRRLGMRAAIDALEAGFAAGVPGLPLRTHTSTPDGQLLLMPAAGDQGVGVKLITLTSANPDRGLPFVQGTYVLFGPGSQSPEAVIDGTSLTRLRTGAVSGLATRFLAREDARRLVVFGAGVQARGHVEAVRTVRDIEEVVIVSRTPRRAEALAAEVGGRVGSPADVAGADIVCTCTTSPRPLFDGAMLPDGVHVNAVGAYTPDTRELDTPTVARARVVVETREVAMAESGDLLIPLAEGAIDDDHVVADLADVVRGADVRRSPRDLTLFVSVGMAFEDLVVARAAVDA
jgi:ornithine cyclodeaminase/alanine dehydrogenase-like protein (mu-crystallin family)